LNSEVRIIRNASFGRKVSVPPESNTNPAAARVAKEAKAELIFPNIVKAGLIFGGAYGEGVLKEGSKIEGYYNSVTASFGWQAGGESYGYVVFLVNDKAVKYIHGNRRGPDGGRCE
jgi:lipid-binding SYLF domain-containing protein